MKTRPFLKRLALSVAISASIIVPSLMLSIVASAQSADDSTIIEEMVVTGSRLKQTNLISPSPVTQVEIEDIRKRGTIDIVDFVNTLPGVVSAQTNEVSNGAVGTASLNLRGLGAARTLVLVDGKRLAPGRPDFIPADLNQIPTALLERVEIVTGGASAVYGSDAIGGVANFILRRNFEGVEIATSYGFNQDGNNNDFAQDVLSRTATDGLVPTGGVIDGNTFDIDVIFGVNSGDGSANITGYFKYVDQSAILQGTRDISRCAFVDIGDFGFFTDIQCLGSNFGPFPTSFSLNALVDPVTNTPLANQPGTLAPGLTVSLDGGGTIPRDANGNIITGANNAFNFNPLNFFQRPTIRTQAGFYANKEFNNHVESYLSVGYTRNVTDAQIAPSATFGEVSQINCDNPFLSGELRQLICTSRGLAGDDLAPIQVNRRNVEGGGRNSRIELSNLRVVGGFRGSINDNWNYDIFGQFSDTAQTTINTEDFEIDLLNEALLAVEDSNGNVVCSSGRDGCIPLNLFGTSPVNLEAINAIAVPTVLTGSSTQNIFGFTIDGVLADYNLPWAEDAPQILGGFEWRRDGLQSQPDNVLLTGNATGLGGPSTPANASSTVYEFFTEVQIPLIQGVGGVENLSFNGAYRYSDYSYSNKLIGGEQSDGFGVSTFALGLSYIPLDDIRFRGQFQRAIRAPNVFELFDPTAIQLFNASDPCSGPTPSASQENCALSGLPAAQFGFVPPDAGQLQELTGGNAGLQPEVANTFTVGAIYQPPIDGLTISLDYFNIDVEDFINTVPSATVLSGCLTNGDPIFCALFNRDDLGTIQIDGFIESNLQNIANRSTDGIDIDINYDFNPAELFGIADIGDFSVRYTSSILFNFEETAFPGDTPLDCLGNFAGGCTGAGGVNADPVFDYRHVTNFVWASKYDVELTLSWRYFSEIENLDGEPISPLTIFESESFLDVSANWQYNQFDVTFGVNNITGNDPGFNSFVDTQNGNTFPSTYDAAGRYIFLAARVSFN